MATKAAEQLLRREVSLVNVMTVPNGSAMARRRGEPQSQLPFKGESFPDYVVHRTPATRLPKSAQHQAGVASPPQSIPVSDCQPRVPPATPTAPIAPTAPSPAKPLDRSPLEALKPGKTQSPSARSIRATQRPSLADQLKAISEDAQSVTTHLKTTYKLTGGAGCESVLATRTSTSSNTAARGEFQATTVSMTVGRLDCRFPCPATFSHSHCAYLFQHPFETKEIQMIMYYRDMVDVSVTPRDKTFRFRIDHRLHQFGDDYTPSNPQHWIKIVFASASDTNKVKLFLAQRRRLSTPGDI